MRRLSRSRVATFHSYHEGPREICEASPQHWYTKDTRNFMRADLLEPLYYHYEPSAPLKVV